MMITLVKPFPHDDDDDDDDEDEEDDDDHLGEAIPHESGLQRLTGHPCLLRIRMVIIIIIVIMFITIIIITIIIIIVFIVIMIINMITRPGLLFERLGLGLSSGWCSFNE